MDLSLIITIIFAIIGIVATWIVTRHYYKKDNKEIKKQLEETIDKITSNMVEVANASNRVGQKGGRVKFHQDEDDVIGADQTKSTDDKIKISENVIGVLDTGEKSKKIVIEHKENISADMILTDSPEKSEKKDKKKQ